MELAHEILSRAITSSTQAVFSTMIGLDARPMRTWVEEGGNGISDGVAALVGLAGAWAGTGCVSCQADFACRIAQQMLMSDYNSVGDDVLDAMGEIANMVIGNIKNSLEERLGPMGLSIPTVVYGRNFSTRTLGKHQWTVVIFEVSGHQFQVQVMLTRNMQMPARNGFAAVRQPA